MVRLFSCEEKLVPARGKALVSTGLCIAVPEGTYGRVAPRSGLGRFTHAITCFNNADSGFDTSQPRSS
jgi:dUTPase